MHLGEKRHWVPLSKHIFVPYHLHVSLPCFTVVSCVCTSAFFNHKPNLIVTRVNG